MNNPQDNNLRGLYLVDDQPAHANRLAIDLSFGWDLPALPESQGAFLNAINGLEDFITDPDSS